MKGEVLIGGGGKTGGAGRPGGQPYHGREGQGVMANWRCLGSFLESIQENVIVDLQ